MTVVVADEEAADAPEHLANRERRRGCGEHRHQRPGLGADGDEAGYQPATKPAEPAHAAAIEKEAEERGLVEMLEDVKELCAEQAADEPVNGGVHRGVGQA